MKLQNKIYLISTFFAVAILGILAFFVYPPLNDIKNNSQKIISDKNQIFFIKKETEELDIFKKNYKEYESNLKKIDKLFVDSKNPVDFVKFLENTAYNSGLQSDISLLQSSKSEVATFQVYVIGDFLKILDFADKLETGSYLITIQNLSIKKIITGRDKEKDTSNKVEANFLIEVITK